MITIQWSPWMSKLKIWINEQIYYNNSLSYLKNVKVLILSVWCTAKNTHVIQKTLVLNDTPEFRRGDSEIAWKLPRRHFNDEECVFNYNNFKIQNKKLRWMTCQDWDNTKLILILFWSILYTLHNLSSK